MLFSRNILLYVVINWKISYIFYFIFSLGVNSTHTVTDYIVFIHLKRSYFTILSSFQIILLLPTFLSIPDFPWLNDPSILVVNLLLLGSIQIFSYSKQFTVFLECWLKVSNWIQHVLHLSHSPW